MWYIWGEGIDKPDWSEDLCWEIVEDKVEKTDWGQIMEDLEYQAKEFGLIFSWLLSWNWYFHKN